MNVRLGIYEIFSRIVPGGVYIVAIVQLLMILGVVNLNFQIVNNLSLAVLLGLIVVAYILGGALDNLALILFRLFKQPKFSARSFAEFKKRYQNRWVIDFDNEDWSILLAYVRTKNMELASELDRHNAISIMSRNIGTGLMMIAINFFIQAALTRNQDFLFLCFIVLILSILTLREAVKFRGWFYDGIYETVLSYRIDLEKSIKAVKLGRRTKQSEPMEDDAK